MSVRSRLLRPLLPAAVALTAIACGDGAPADSVAVRVATETRAEHAGDAEAYAIRRNRLIREIKTTGMVGDERVLAAIRRVPRHAFVRPEYLDEAYENHPLPIGEGQTISQPLIVAVMTETLHINPGDRVLEVGTGSGYQAAVLAEMGADVYTTEIIPSLSAWGRQNLVNAGYGRVTVLEGDGYYGAEDHAPYDGIVVTAAPDHIPDPLVRQLRIGGRMAVPVGPPGFYQTLWVIERGDEGVRSTNLGPVSFVPLTGARDRAQAE